MPSSIHQLLFLALCVIGVITIAFVEALPTHLSGSDAVEAAHDTDADTFQLLLNAVSDDSLHAALHDYSPSKFKHGVFREDRTAIEAVHKDNAAIATKLVQMAKRQSSSNSSTPVSPNTPSTPASTPAKSSSPANNPSSSTTSNSPTTNSASPRPASPSTTAESSEQSTSNEALTSIHTSSTSTVLLTTTLADGSRSTVTSFTVVGFNVPASTPGGSGALGTATGSPKLQSGDAIPAARRDIKIIGGVVGGALVGLLVL